MVISPTVRSRVLVRRLRALRDDTGLTQTQVAKDLGWRQSKISRIEAGDQPVSVADAHAFASFYDLPAKERDQMVALARDAKKQGWWQSYDDVMPEWFDTLVGMEAEASSVFTYESDIVPGLLQTEDYARAATQAAVLDATADEIQRRVELRMTRQQRFLEDGLEYWAVVGEASLLRPVGGENVLGEQLDRLLKLTELPNITLQVMPFEAGGHPAIGPFVILGFAQQLHPDVAYVETQAGAQWVEETNQVRTFVRVAEHLRAHALDPDDSKRAIRERMGGS